MSIPDLVERVRSGVIHIEFRVDGKRVGSGSGFVTKSFLITNYHVFRGPPNSTVVLASQRNQDPTSRTEIHMTYQEFAGSCVSASDENNYDFAILKIVQLQHFDLHEFDLISPNHKRVGDQIAILGFPFEHRNLTCHVGTISSFYNNRAVRVIQLDISVNQSNSGGPLLDSDTGQVLGIVTRKGTGLSNQFDMLRKAFRANLEQFAIDGVIENVPVDKVALVVGQYQMEELAKEILRSANVGIGYAFSIEHLLSDAALHSD